MTNYDPTSKADKHYEISPTSPSRRWVGVTASDTVNFDRVARAIRFNVAGNVVIIGADDAEETITVFAGETFPGNVKRINITGSDVAAVANGALLAHLE